MTEWKMGDPCPNCGSENHEWNVGADVSRSGGNHTFPFAFLGCVECSETLAHRNQDWIEDVLNRSGEIEGEKLL